MEFEPCQRNEGSEQTGLNCTFTYLNEFLQTAVPWVIEIPPLPSCFSLFSHVILLLITMLRYDVCIVFRCSSSFLFFFHGGIILPSFSFFPFSLSSFFDVVLRYNVKKFLQFWIIIDNVSTMLSSGERKSQSSKRHFSNYYKKIGRHRFSSTLPLIVSVRCESFNLFFSSSFCSFEFFFWRAIICFAWNIGNYIFVYDLEFVISSFDRTWRNKFGPSKYDTGNTMT